MSPSTSRTALGDAVEIPTLPSDAMRTASPLVLVWKINPSSPFAASITPPSAVVYNHNLYVVFPPICIAGFVASPMLLEFELSPM